MYARLSRSLKGQLILWALWLSMLAALVTFRRVLLPFAIALIIAYLLEPLVTRLTRLRIRGWSPRRWMAVIALYAAFFGLLYLFARAAIPTLYTELAGLTKEGMRFFNDLTPDRIAAWSERLEMWLLNRGIPVDLSGGAGAEAGALGFSLDLESSLREGLGKLSAVLKAHFLDAVGLVRRLVGGVLGAVFHFFFILMVAAFILIDWSQIGAFFRSLVPAERRAEYQELMKSIDGRLAGVVRGQAMICVVNGVLTAVGLLLFNVPFVIVLSLTATALSAIPIFGTIISSVPIVLFGLTVGWKTGLGILAWICGIHALEAYFLNPKIMGQHAHIHPVVVAFALLAGQTTYGFVGALFAVPVAGVLITLFATAHERAQAKLAAAAAPPTDSESGLPPAA